MSFDASYEIAARYYDASYGYGGRRGDLEFYSQLAHDLGGPVLEIGCGTGRILLPIAASGLRCTGLDASEAMLQEMRRKGGVSGVNLVCSSMESFELQERFQLIFSAFRSFQHLNSTHQQLACLKTVARHLRPGGTFAFDVMSIRPDEMRRRHEPEWLTAEFQCKDVSIRRYVSVERDFDKQQLHITTRFSRSNGEGLLPDELVRITLRWFRRRELKSLLHAVGFKHVAIYGDFARNIWSPASQSMVVVAT